jgi:hypothetical protein
MTKSLSLFIPLDPNGAPESLVCTRAIARYLGLDAQTIRKWVHDGKFPKADLRLNRRYQRWKLGTVRAALQAMGRWEPKAKAAE